MWLQRVCVVIISLFLFVPLAHAQPELKVGQEVEIYYNGKRNVCIVQDVFQLSEDWMVGCLVGGKRVGFRVPTYVDSYRILKPAPRPKFELLIYAGSCSPENQDSIECAVYANQGAIADELRYLHKKIEALKK